MSLSRPQQDRRSSPADFSDTAHLQKQLSDAADAIASMADEIGLAKHILEFSSDRHKRALARAMAAPLAGGSSHNKAEAEARASESYGKELDVLASQHKAAEQTIMKYDAMKIRWETARSILSLLKEQVRQL